MLVVSAGEAGKLVARALQDVGIARVTVTSRTFERAASLADSLGGEAVPFERLESALAAADIVITASGHFRFKLGRYFFLIDFFIARRNRHFFLVPTLSTI